MRIHRRRARQARIPSAEKRNRNQSSRNARLSRPTSTGSPALPTAGSKHDPKMSTAPGLQQAHAHQPNSQEVDVETDRIALRDFLLPQFQRGWISSSPAGGARRGPNASTKHVLSRYVCDFGPVVAGATRTKKVKIHNIGQGAVIITIPKLAQSGAFDLAPSGQLRLAEGASIEFTATLAATRPELVEGIHEVRCLGNALGSPRNYTRFSSIPALR